MKGVKEIIYGRNAVYEALRAKRRECFVLQIADGVKPAGRVAEIMELAARDRVPALMVPRARLDQLNANHQGVALEAGTYPYSDVVEILEQPGKKGELPFVLLLDALQDPQNFGTLLRTAEIVGVHGVVIPLARAVGVTPAVVNASAGATEHLHIAQANLSQAMDALKQSDVWIVGLDQEGQEIGEDTDRHLHGSVGLVVGSEGEGLRQLTRKKCDVLLKLPMKGRIESLNAAVAGSVALYLAYMARAR
ncbi:MAG TPA: 23S rRNA (guanosine(2251)-2'-O)-methyltransferase RlmB [Anaerolineales bacterium]